MASADVISGIISSLRTCGVCNQECCDPRTLECMHSLCFDCLKGLINQNLNHGEIFCPTCKCKIMASPSSLNNSVLENLGAASVFTDERISTFQKPGTVACRKHPNYLCEYFCKDSFDLACEVCKMNRPFCQKITEEAMAEVLNRQQTRVKELLSTTNRELTEICESLKSRERQKLSKKDGTVLGIMKYFADLKMQLLDYLAQHEKDVLDKLKIFTDTEMATITQYTKLSFSLLDSLGPCSASVNSIFKNADKFDSFASYLNLDVLIPTLEDFTAKATTIKQYVQDENEIRFVINTEFEDMLTEGDLISIELINSSTRSSGAVIPSDSNISQRYHTRIDNHSVTNENSESTDVTPTTTNVAMRNEQPSTGIVIRVSPPDTNSDYQPGDEPPPPYPGLTKSSSTTYSNRQNPTPVTQNQYRFPQPNSNDAIRNTSNSPVSQPHFTYPQLNSNNNGRNNSPVLQEQFSYQPVPSAPNFDDFFTTPVVPRGLTHGVSSRSITPPGTPGDDNRLRFYPLTKFTVGLRGKDRENPILGDLCWIDERALIAIDKRNKTAKVFNTRGSSINVCNLNGDPYGCTVFRLPRQPCIYMAVTFPKQRNLSIYTIDPMTYYQISVESTKITNKGYTCLSFNENKMQFVCGTTNPFSLPSVDILDHQGNFLRTFNGSDAVRLGYPRSVGVNKQGIIGISDYKTSRVIFMTMEGAHESVFDGTVSRNLGDPQGIGLYKNLFVVADTRKNHIYFVDSSSVVYDEVRQQSLLEKTPRFIDFSPSSCPKMAVGHGNGYISLYEVFDASNPDIGSTV
ncbi:unnamed protein product [Mytilus coruscus]|uniref:RING-type domain-containing protein n=1 Tax=Mytilus coruscus TaxID=42192 RepID=A0A6J8EG15_MYTCO|nr:unnamed protein product [Mytilus coruscus]